MEVKSERELVAEVKAIMAKYPTECTASIVEDVFITDNKDKWEVGFKLTTSGVDTGPCFLAIGQEVAGLQSRYKLGKKGA